MERPDFLAELRSASANLREHFRESSAEWLTHVVPESPDDAPPDKPGIAYLYELVCCFSLLVGLKHRGVRNLRLVSAPGPNGFRFPYSPGEKQNFAFFRFEWDGRTFDVCTGTAVHPPDAPSSDPDEHPDISIQRFDALVADAHREQGVVVALWDAKLHGEELPKDDENQMLRWCSLFPRTKGEGPDLEAYYWPNDFLEQVCPPAFQVCGVLTNAPAKPFSSTSAFRHGYSLVFNFLGNAETARPTPTRSQHYHH